MRPSVPEDELPPTYSETDRLLQGTDPAISFSNILGNSESAVPLDGVALHGEEGDCTHAFLA